MNEWVSEDWKHSCYDSRRAALWRLGLLRLKLWVNSLSRLFRLFSFHGKCWFLCPQVVVLMQPTIFTNSCHLLLEKRHESANPSLLLAKQFRPQIHCCIVFICARSCGIRYRNAYPLPTFWPTNCISVSVWINVFCNWKLLGEIESEMLISHSREPATKSALVHSRFEGRLHWNITHVQRNTQILSAEISKVSHCECVHVTCTQTRKWD